MRVLLLHTTTFQSKLVKPSNWPKGIEPETQKSDVEEMTDCLVCFFTVELPDGQKQINELHAEIIKTAQEVGTHNLVLSPFVHLSNNIASPQRAKELYEKLVNSFANNDYTIITSHFGYHKSLLLDIKGHPGSFRYREFN